MEFDKRDLDQNTTENHLGVPGLPSKYNYAGPGTYFHARQKGSDYYKALMKHLGKPLVGTEPYDKPYNKLDAAAMAHDAVYANKNATTEEIRRSDEAIIRAAKNIDVSDGLDQFILAQATIIGFNVKGGGENIGFFPRGWLANGQESHMAHVQHLAKNVLGVFNGTTELSLMKSLEKLLIEYSIHLTRKGLNATATNPQMMAPFWAIFGLLVYKGTIKFPSFDLVGRLNTRFNNMIRRNPALRRVFTEEIDLGALIETHCPPKLARVIRQVRAGGAANQTESRGVEMTEIGNVDGAINQYAQEYNDFGIKASDFLDSYGTHGEMSIADYTLEQNFQNFMGPGIDPGPPPPVNISDERGFRGESKTVGTESKADEGMESIESKTVGTFDNGGWGENSGPPAPDSQFAELNETPNESLRPLLNKLVEQQTPETTFGERPTITSGDAMMGGAMLGFTQPIFQAGFDRGVDSLVSEDMMSNPFARDITKGTLGSAAYTPAAAAMTGMSMAEVFPPILAGTVTAELLKETSFTGAYKDLGASGDAADVLDSTTKGALVGGVVAATGGAALPLAIAGIAVSATLGAATTALEKWHSGDPDPLLQDENGPGPSDAETNAFQKNMEIIKDPNSGENELLEANEKMWLYMRKYRPSEIPSDIGFEEIQDDDKNTLSDKNRRRLREEEARWRPYSKKRRKDKEQWAQLHSKAADRSITTDELTDFWVLTHNYMSDLEDFPLTAEQKTHINKLTQEKATLKDKISKQDEAIHNIFETGVSYDQLSPQLQQEIAMNQTKTAVTDTDKQFLHGLMMGQTYQAEEIKEKTHITDIDIEMRKDFRIAAEAQTKRNKEILDLRALLEQLNAKMTERRNDIIGNLVKYGKITHLIYLDRPKREKPTIEGLVYI